MPQRRRTALYAAALAGGVFEVALFLPWYGGYEDSGPYHATAWSSYDWFDILAASLAAIAILCALVQTVVAARREALLNFVAAAIGALLAIGVVVRGLGGHADHDFGLTDPLVGIFVALAASVALVAAELLARSCVSDRTSAHDHA
jgi:hypothetical protein